MDINGLVTKNLRQLWQRQEEIVAHNTARTVQAFRTSRLATSDLMGSTGYGYDDRGRAILDRIVAQIFGTEAGLLRAQWASGTHALATGLRAITRPGSTLWLLSGPLYDTMQPTLNQLRQDGVHIRTMGLDPGGNPLYPPDQVTLGDVVYVQRSRGYSARRSWGKTEIETAARWAHEGGGVLMVDNCYGEFTQPEEPGHWGADLVIGSLMKNPGGTIAPTGAYAAGSGEIVRKVADTLFAPGIGGEVGATSPYLRLFAQGLFLSPQLVGEAMAGGLYVSHRADQLGIATDPGPHDLDRNDIVVAVELGEPKRVIQFCQTIQSWSPVDAAAMPEPWEMPGYEHPVVMAAGGFVSGSSLELSADAPMRLPYRVYLQGGVNRWHTILAVNAAFDALVKGHE